MPGTEVTLDSSPKQMIEPFRLTLERDSTGFIQLVIDGAELRDLYSVELTAGPAGHSVTFQKSPYAMDKQRKELAQPQHRDRETEDNRPTTAGRGGQYL